MKNPKLRKAVIPVGLDDNNLHPASRAVPAEMLPVVDRPLVQYAVEEALASGLDELIFVTQQGLTIVEDHFAEKRGPLREDDRSIVGRPSSWGPAGRPRQILICRQNEGGGLAKALWSARNLIGAEAFAVLMPSDLLLGETPAMAQMIAQYDEHGGNVVAVADDGLRQREGTSAAISAGSKGRYILQPDVFDALERQDRLDLNQAILSMAEAWSLRAVAVKGRHFDCRTPAGLLEAQVAYALGRGGDLANAMDDVLERYGTGRLGRESFAKGTSLSEAGD
ncbi:hypothetical protein HBA54_03525 [Pelagibius litoralis]|uniref:UTP--glucose-1-phosphate uridylyltransferase n=1 Tax=Pelagibius litoralis TaxID=374515 RepID=A0A967C1Q6_9PROT|nr:sugar phosphate nucleotidyltransferase [Pelagibius litoralis]NIA67651.1 hypothetical protein [Pelagibius litoralis]